jgi:hypothetical protein
VLKKFRAAIGRPDNPLRPDFFPAAFVGAGSPRSVHERGGVERGEARRFDERTAFDEIAGGMGAHLIDIEPSPRWPTTPGAPPKSDRRIPAANLTN